MVEHLRGNSTPSPSGTSASRAIFLARDPTASSRSTPPATAGPSAAPRSRPSSPAAFSADPGRPRRLPPPGSVPAATLCKDTSLAGRPQPVGRPPGPRASQRPSPTSPCSPGARSPRRRRPRRDRARRGAQSVRAHHDGRRGRRLPFRRHRFGGHPWPHARCGHGIRAITATARFAATNEDGRPRRRGQHALYGAEHTVRRVGEAEFAPTCRPSSKADWRLHRRGQHLVRLQGGAPGRLKVALSGLGGDELFAGYPSCTNVPRWAPWLTMMSGLGVPARALANSSRSRPAPGAGRAGAGRRLSRRLPPAPRPLPPRRTRGPPPLPTSCTMASLACAPSPRRSCPISPDPGGSPRRKMLRRSSAYMRNQLLRDADWAGMAHSLEIRTPLVDIAALTALAPWPRSASPRGAGRRAGHRPLALPPEILARAKTGFGVPDWRFGPTPPGVPAPSRAWPPRRRWT